MPPAAGKFLFSVVLIVVPLTVVTRALLQNLVVTAHSKLLSPRRLTCSDRRKGACLQEHASLSYDSTAVKEERPRFFLIHHENCFKHAQIYRGKQHSTHRVGNSTTVAVAAARQTTARMRANCMSHRGNSPIRPTYHTAVHKHTQ